MMRLTAFLRSRVKTIYGCADNPGPYLTRITLLKTPWGCLKLHWFHRGDEAEHHDHPWDFLSLILWGGYTEETPCKCGSGVRRVRYRPGALLRRPAEWAHAVRLEPGRKALTLVWMNRPRRDWGFYLPHWVYWRHFFKARGCE